MVGHTCSECGYTTPQLSRLRRHHVSQHSAGAARKASCGAQRAQCGVCLSWYASRASLRRHQRTAHQIYTRPDAFGKFCCTLCASLHRNSDDFLQHHHAQHEDEHTKFEKSTLQIPRADIELWRKQYEHDTNTRYTTRSSEYGHTYLRCATFPTRRIDGIQEITTCPAFIRINCTDDIIANITVAGTHTHDIDVEKLSLRNSLLEDKIVEMLNKHFTPDKIIEELRAPFMNSNGVRNRAFYVTPKDIKEIAARAGVVPYQRRSSVNHQAMSEDIRTCKDEPGCSGVIDLTKILEMSKQDEQDEQEEDDEEEGEEGEEEEKEEKEERESSFAFRQMADQPVTEHGENRRESAVARMRQTLNTWLDAITNCADVEFLEKTEKIFARKLREISQRRLAVVGSRMQPFRKVKQEPQFN